MAGLIKQLIDGVVDAAVKEVLRKVGIGRTAAGSRTRKKASGGLLSDILDAALAPEKKTAKKTAAKPARGSAAKKPAKRTAAAAAKKKTRRG